MWKLVKLCALRIALKVGEYLEDRVLVGDEGCLWPVERIRDELMRMETELLAA